MKQQILTYVYNSLTNVQISVTNVNYARALIGFILIFVVMREILLLILITFSTIVSGTNYYVSNNGNDNNDGLSEGKAWKTVSKVNSRTFKPGDNILFERGGIWNENLEITSSGSSAGQITYSAYGDKTKKKPVFNGISEVSGWKTAGNWTNMGNNVWRINISHSGIYGRVWINNVEAVRSNYAAEGKGLSVTRKFQKINNRLYVYSTSNPASALTSLKITNRSAFFTATNQNYITLNNLEIRGWHEIIMTGCSNWIIEYCDLMQSGMRGFSITRNGTTRSNKGVIRHCNFNTEFDYSEVRVFGVDSGDWFYFYTEYAIRFIQGGISDWDIHDNEFHRWGYTTYWFTNTENTNGVYKTEGLRFFRNYVETTNMNYGRHFAGRGRLENFNSAKPNEVYNNVFKNQASPVQVSMAYLEIYNNVFDGSYCTHWPDKEHSSPFNPINFGNDTPYEMKVFNNVFAYGAYSGMFLSMSNNLHNMRFVNNIFYENGYNNSWQQLRVSTSGTGTLTNSQFDNNIFYAAARTDVFHIFGKRLTVPQFNALDGNNDRNLNPKNNIYADPLFVDPENGDFRLQPGSPAIGAGLTPLSGKDMAGTEWGDKPNIGPYAINDSKGPDKFYILSLENEGNGIVLSNGLEENSVSVENDSTITIEAIPDSGWIFSNWEGDVSGSANPTEIKMNQDKNIKAVFIEETFTLTIICEGEGEVTIFPAQESYVSGTMINLEAHAEGNWQFQQWEGDLLSTDIQTSIVIEKNMVINARFSTLITNSDLINEGERNIKIYPNPARAYITISAENSEVKPEGFNILDLSGKIVFQGKLVSNFSDIQIPGFLNSGIYIIELISKKIPFYNQRLVITK
jgi:hypothetical protein